MILAAQSSEMCIYNSTVQVYNICTKPQNWPRCLFACSETHYVEEWIIHPAVYRVHGCLH